MIKTIIQAIKNWSRIRVIKRGMEWPDQYKSMIILKENETIRGGKVVQIKPKPQTNAKKKKKAGKVWRQYKNLF